MEKIVRVYYTTFIDVPCESENFSNEDEMVEWAKDNNHDGTYYIDCPNITFRKTRQQILNENDKNKFSKGLDK